MAASNFSSKNTCVLQLLFQLLLTMTRCPGRERKSAGGREDARRKQDNLEGEDGKSDVRGRNTTPSHLQKGPTWTKPFPASIIEYPTCGAPTCKATADVCRRAPRPATQKATPVS